MIQGRRSWGQTAVEYMLAVSVIVVAIAGAYYLVIGENGQKGPIGKSFENVRKNVEKPYP